MASQSFFCTATRTTSGSTSRYSGPASSAAGIAAASSKISRASRCTAFRKRTGCGSASIPAILPYSRSVKRWCRLTFIESPEQRLGVRRRGRLVHEVDEDLAPAGGGEPLGPALQILVGIQLEPQAHIAPRRGLHQRRGRVVLALGQAKCRSRALQDVVDIVGEPAVVAELE